MARGDLLLLKGSRGVKMEKILEAIDANHARLNAASASFAAKKEHKGQQDASTNEPRATVETKGRR